MEMIIVILYIVFLIFNMNQTIIRDYGLYKLIIFNIGMIMIFISNFLLTYMNYAGCSFNFIFKYFGIGLLVSVYYCYINISMELGVLNHDDEKYKAIVNVFVSQMCTSTSRSQSMDSIRSAAEFKESCMKLGQEIYVVNPLGENQNIEENNKNINKEIGVVNTLKEEPSIEELNKNIELKLMKLNSTHTNKTNLKKNNLKSSTSINSLNIMSKFKNIYRRKDTDENSSVYSEKLDYNKLSENIIKVNHSFIKEIFIFNSIYIIIIFIFIVFQKNDDDSINFINITKGWIYQCKLDKIDLFFNIIYFIFMINILIHGRKLYKYQCIYKLIHYLTITSYIIILCPLLNVIIYI